MSLRLLIFCFFLQQCRSLKEWEKPCSVGCEVCYVSFCQQCKVGYFGSECDTTCNDKCRRDGSCQGLICRNGCTLGRWGDTCENYCYGCTSGCHQHNGNCIIVNRDSGYDETEESPSKLALVLKTCAIVVSVVVVLCVVAACCRRKEESESSTTDCDDNNYAVGDMGRDKYGGHGTATRVRGRELISRGGHSPGSREPTTFLIERPEEPFIAPFAPRQPSPTSLSSLSFSEQPSPSAPPPQMRTPSQHSPSSPYMRSPSPPPPPHVRPPQPAPPPPYAASSSPAVPPPSYSSLFPAGGQR